MTRNETMKAAGFHFGNGSWTGRADAIPQEVRR